MQEKVQNILSNLKDAAVYAATGQEKHPNRLDIMEGTVSQSNTRGGAAFGQPSGQQSTSRANPFGAATPAAHTNPFGQPSPLSQPSAIAQPSSFPQPTNQPRAAGFGQPSA